MRLGLILALVFIGFGVRSRWLSAGEFTQPGERMQLRRLIVSGKTGGQTIIGGFGPTDGLTLVPNIASTWGSGAVVINVPGTMDANARFALDLLPAGVTIGAGGDLEVMRIQPTVTFNADSNAFGASVISAVTPTLQNASGVAENWHGISTYSANMTIKANNGNLTLNTVIAPGYAGMMVEPTFSQAGSPTSTVDRVVGLHMAGGISGSGWTTTTWGAVHQADPSNTGVITNLYAVDVDALTHGTNVAALNSAITAAAGRWFLHDVGGAASTIKGKLQLANNTAPTNDLGFDGTAARVIGLDANTTASTAGQNLTVNAGADTSGSTDLNGGTLILASGGATGNGASEVDFQTVDKSQGTGTTARAVATRLKVKDGHVISSGTTPTLSSCGNGGPSVVGTDTAGKITTGTASPASCTLTFAKTYVNAPSCVVADDSSVAAVEVVTTTSTMVLTVTTGASSAVYSYICVGTE